MTSEEIQTVILLILVGLVGLSVALWLLRQLWAVINTPVAIAIVLAVLGVFLHFTTCLLYTSPSPRDRQKSRMPSSA